MDSDFWIMKWENNETGFHEETVNRHLQKFWPELGLKGSDAVFVPLCGKSLDMIWLSGLGHPVLGVELSQKGVNAFFDENNLVMTQRREGRFTVCCSDNLKITCGDFFDLAAHDLKDVKGVYDRAALVAMPPDLRSRYVRQLVNLLPPAAKVLLLTLEYPMEEMEGPPFSVTEDDVRTLYGPDFEVTLLLKGSILDDNPHFKNRGLTRLEEKVYVLRSPRT